MKGVNINYSDKELSFIKTNCTLPRKDMHKLFCLKFNRNDASQANISSLCKRRNWMTGRAGCYEKGNIPHPGAGAKSANKTSFKKGHKPESWVPVGTERMTKDGLIEIKVENPSTWKSKHLCIWEKEHGKIPDGHIVTFIDGDDRNFSLDNLDLISRNENLQINRLKCEDDSIEVSESVRLIGKAIAKTQELKVK